MQTKEQSKQLSAREKEEQRIAFSDTDVITRMMMVLEYRWYVDTDWRSETTFEEDVRPLFEKMLNSLTSEGEKLLQQEKINGDEFMDKIMEDMIFLFHNITITDEKRYSEWIRFVLNKRKDVRQHLHQEPTPKVEQPATDDAYDWNKAKELFEREIRLWISPKDRFFNPEVKSETATDWCFYCWSTTWKCTCDEDEKKEAERRDTEPATDECDLWCKHNYKQRRWNEEWQEIWECSKCFKEKIKEPKVEQKKESESKIEIEEMVINDGNAVDERAVKRNIQKIADYLNQ